MSPPSEADSEAHSEQLIPFERIRTSVIHLNMCFDDDPEEKMIMK